MLRWMLAVLGAVAAIAVALLLWELRAGPRARAPTAAGGAPSAGPPDTAGESTLREGVPARRLRHAPTEQEVGRDRMQLLLADDVPQRVLRAAAACYDGRPGQSERMKVGYRLVLERGRASLVDVRLVSTELHAPELEGCVLDAMRRLTWTDRGAPDMNRTMDLEISILDLKARAPRDERAADAPDENALDD